MSYTRTAPPGIGGQNGPGNYWIPVRVHSTFYVYPSLNSLFLIGLYPQEWYEYTIVFTLFQLNGYQTLPLPLCCGSSIHEVCHPFTQSDRNSNYTLCKGGFFEPTGQERVPDWVDDTVAGWIKEQTSLMDAAWGPAEQNRGALAFVHIPPYVLYADSYSK